MLGVPILESTSFLVKNCEKTPVEQRMADLGRYKRIRPLSRD